MFFIRAIKKLSHVHSFINIKHFEFKGVYVAIFSSLLTPVFQLKLSSAFKSKSNSDENRSVIAPSVCLHFIQILYNSYQIQLFFLKNGHFPENG